MWSQKQRKYRTNKHEVLFDNHKRNDDVALPIKPCHIAQKKGQVKLDTKGPEANFEAV